MKLPLPTFDYETIHWEQGRPFIAGVDEVGRGSFAGPVVTAAVILPPDFPQDLGVTDSKLLTPSKREALAKIITAKALAYAIGEVCVECINIHNIGKATQMAFYKAIQGLTISPDHILIDAFYIDGIDKVLQTPIIKGDQKSLSIAAASIVAKVYRDKLMTNLPSHYTPYDFATNKGYGTAKHREAIKTQGLSDMHRKIFKFKTD